MKRWNVVARWAAVVTFAASMAWADGITAEQRAEYWRAMSENAQAQSVVQQIRAVEAQLPKAQQDADAKQKALSDAYNKLAASCKGIHKNLVADQKGEPDCVVSSTLTATEPAKAAPGKK